ncbi:hypothetical protein ACOSP7_002473 [Xanthoceras sorbifolium]
MRGAIPINNYLKEDGIVDMEQFSDTKFFDWRILNFCLRNKVDIEFWVDIGTNRNPNPKIETNKYQTVDKINKKELFDLTIHEDEELNPSNQKKFFFYWMGMNDEILSCPISNLELWFFRELVPLFNAYKMKPRIIPIKQLLFNFNGNENGNKNITKKEDLFISSNKKKFS